jgi:pyruvate,water dikinase
MTDLKWQIDEPGAWQLDSGHFPVPLTRYFQPILREEFPRGFREGSRKIGLLLSHFDHTFVNGFDYNCARPVGAPKAAKGPPPFLVFKLLCWFHPEIRARLRTASATLERKAWREDLALWQNEVRPSSTKTHLELQRENPAELADDELVAYLSRLRNNARHQYYLHHRFTVSAFAPVGDFIAHVRDWTGLSAGELLQACRQPKGVATVASEQFDRVVHELKGSSEARALLSGNDPPSERLLALARLPGNVGVAASEWLEMTGQRLVTGYDIVDLTALEMPELLLRTLEAALLPRNSAHEARQELSVRVRDAVPDRHRNEYDALLAEALSVSSLREERALVCDFWALGLVRRAVKEAGQRVARAGRAHDAAHLFDASHEEMLSLVLGQTGPSAAELKARYDYRTTTTCDGAPKWLGSPPAPPPPVEWYPEASRRLNRAVDAAVHALFDEPDPRAEPKLVRGLNASAGRYEGRARVVLGPETFTRIERGDVLVARMTTEAYNGVMPLLGAVVTDRGGLLSHAATVAREYGIPAVVGTQLATKTIPDGARVLVDGARGEARLV